MARAIRGDYFQGTLLYVQTVRKSDTEQPEHIELTIGELREKITPTTGRVAGKIDNKLMFRSSLNLKITDVWIYSVPLMSAIEMNPLIHTFVVFKTVNKQKNDKEMWWSFEKDRYYITLRQSRHESDVRDFYWKSENHKFTKRTKDLDKIKVEISAKSQCTLQDLLEEMLKQHVITDPYHFYLSNCQKFAAFIFNEINSEGKMWKAPVSGNTWKSLVQREFRYGKTLITNQVRIGKHVTNEEFLLGNVEGRRLAIKAIITRQPSNLENSRKLQTDTINVPDCQGYTLLEWAEAFKRQDIIDYLKGKGATVGTNYKRNAFFIALQYWDSAEGEFPIVDWKGIDYKDHVNVMGDSVLHLALYGMDNNRMKMFKDLVKLCDVNAVNKRGETPLHVAVRRKCTTRTFEIILRKSLDVINKGDKDGLTPLHYAIYTHSKEKTKLLLEMGAKIDGVTKVDRQTPLHLAATNWNNCPNDIVKKLAKNDINAKDKKNFTALQLALESKHEKISQLLFNNGASIAKTAYCLNKETLHVSPIFLASKCRTIPVTLAKEIIKEYRLEINKFDKFGFTPLHWTLKMGSLEMSNWLLDLQADSCKTTQDENGEGKKDTEDSCKTTQDENGEGDEEIKNFLSGFQIHEDSCKTTQDENGEGKKDTADSCKTAQDENGKCKKDIANSCTQDDKGDSVFHLIARFRNIDNKICRKLITRFKKQSNSDLFEMANKEGYSPIHTAVESNNLFAVGEYLKLGAKVNLETKEVKKQKTEKVGKKKEKAKPLPGMTPLHLAMNNPKDSLDVLKRLFKENDINVKIKDSRGKTPLFFALKTKSKKKTKFFLGKLLNKLENEHLKDNPLHLASAWPQIPSTLFDLLLQNCDVNGKDKKDYTPLHKALRFGAKEHAEKLLDNGAKVTLVTKNDNYTVLHLLFKYWNNCPKELIEKILEKCGDEKSAMIEKEDKNGCCALDLAIQSKSVEHVDVLLELGANVTRAPQKITPLHVIAEMWSDCPRRIIEALLGKGADINAKDDKGKTPLHKAIQAKSINVAECLLDQAKVNVNIPDEIGFTPLHLIEKNLKPDCPKDFEKNLTSKGVKSNVEIELAIQSKSKENVDVLLKHRVKAPQKNTPLHLIAEMWSDCPQTIIKAILGKGADINAKDGQGKTPLHKAIQAKSINVAKCLLDQATVNVNIPDENGFTPLHLVAESWNYCPTDFIKNLISKGAKLDAQDGKGHTPLYWAITSHPMSRLFLYNGAQPPSNLLDSQQ